MGIDNFSVNILGVDVLRVDVMVLPCPSFI